MHRFLLAASTILYAASVVAAAESTKVDLQNFGGSALSFAAGKTTLKTFYQPDGSFVTVDESAPKGEWTAKGLWRMQDNSLCTRHTESKVEHEVDTTETCLAIPVAHYGESWTVNDKIAGEVQITVGKEQLPF